MDFEITVRYSGGDYVVHGGRGAIARAGEYIRAASPSARQAVIITDEYIRPLYSRTLGASLEGADFKVVIVTLPAGEDGKDVNNLFALYREFLAAGLGRGDVIVALGGGAVSDVAGFAAATFKRGMPWAVVPTTLLSQLDACIGGKVGVDFEGFKNVVGAFYHPMAVAVDTQLLATLPARHLVAGFAEAVKYGILIGGDYWTKLEDNAGSLLAGAGPLDEIIAGGLAYKAAVVERDDRDFGQRHLLNLGHTIGHALESASRFRLPHGEAVAVGLVYTCLLAELRGHMATDEVIRVVQLLRRFGLPTYLPTLPLERIVRALVGDKKMVNGDIFMAIPYGIGSVVLEPVPLTVLSHLLPQVHALARRMR